LSKNILLNLTLPFPGFKATRAIALFLVPEAIMVLLILNLST